MSPSSKSKSLRVERLESRELMASYIGHSQPSEWHAIDGPTERGVAKDSGEWSTTVRFGGNYGVERDESPVHFMDRDGRTKGGMKPIDAHANFDPTRMGYVVPVRQINVFFAVLLSDSPKNNSVQQRTTVSPWIQEIDFHSGTGEGFAEGESGEEIAKNTRVQESEATHPLRIAERPSTPRPPVVLGGEAFRESNNESAVTNTCANQNCSISREYFEDEVPLARFQLKDDYFAQLGGATVDNEEARTLQEAYLDLFTKGFDEEIASEFFRKLESQNIDEIELNWDYLVPNTIGEEWGGSNSSENKQQSLFAIYDAAQQGLGSIAPKDQGMTQLLKAASDRIDEVKEFDSSLTDARYWVISLAIASVWFGFQQQKVRSRLFDNLSSLSRLPK